MEKDLSSGTGRGSTPLVLRACAGFPFCFLMDSLIRGSLAFLIQALLDPARSSFLTQSASSRRQTSGQPRLGVLPGEEVLLSCHFEGIQSQEPRFHFHLCLWGKRETSREKGKPGSSPSDPFPSLTFNSLSEHEFCSSQPLLCLHKG